MVETLLTRFEQKESVRPSRTATVLLRFSIGETGKRRVAVDLNIPENVEQINRFAVVIVFGKDSKSVIYSATTTSSHRGSDMFTGMASVSRAHQITFAQPYKTLADILTLGCRLEPDTSGEDTQDVIPPTEISRNNESCRDSRYCRWILLLEK